MKVTALGVNSAFATGKYHDSLTVEDLNDFVESLGKKNHVYAAGALKQLFTDFAKSRQKKLYDPKWQSNFLLEFDSPGKISGDIYRFVIDCGGDIRHSLARSLLKYGQVDTWYISHPHADHIGGVEGAALSTFFNPYFVAAKQEWIKKGNDIMENAGTMPNAAKPNLIGDRTVIDELWRATAPGLETLQGVMSVKISTYFNVKHMENNVKYRIKDGDRTWTYYTVVSTHVVTGAKMMPSYGLMFECSDGQKVYFPTDTQFMAPPQIETFYRRADVVYQDCETTTFRSSVHANIIDLKTLAPEIRKKLKLYHYDEEPTPEDAAQFGGVLRTGDVHVY